MVQAAGTVSGTGCGTASGTTFRSRYQSALGLGEPLMAGLPQLHAVCAEGSTP